MRELVAITQVSVDGIMQAPGGPEEDRTDGFAHGGWAMPFVDDALGRVIDEIMHGEFDLLLGRRTYDIFAGYWPNQGANPIAEAFNKATKYVVTRGHASLPWARSERIAGDVPAAIRRLKASTGPALHVWGSSQLLQDLMAADLVDEFRLWISPVVLGTGSTCSGAAFRRGASSLSRPKRHRAGS